MAKNLKLNAVKFGLAGGILSGLCVLITTISAISGYLVLWTDLIAAAYGFLGYSVSWFGVVLGSVYGFIDGFIITWIFALIYNKLL